MNNFELGELVYKIGVKGDKLAFKRIFNYFAPRIIGYLVGTNSNKEFAEEVAQEVLTTVWKKASQFDYKKGNINTWIFTIARNKRIDRIRKKENPKYNKEDLIEALYSPGHCSNSDMEQKIIQIQQNLNNYEKKLINMSFFQGKTHNIISRDLEIPLGTVKSKIRKILTKMRNL